MTKPYETKTAFWNREGRVYGFPFTASMIQLLCVSLYFSEILHLINANSLRGFSCSCTGCLLGLLHVTFSLPFWIRLWRHQGFAFMEFQKEPTPVNQNAAHAASSYLSVTITFSPEFSRWDLNLISCQHLPWTGLVTKLPVLVLKSSSAILL